MATYLNIRCDAALKGELKAISEQIALLAPVNVSMAAIAKMLILEALDAREAKRAKEGGE